MGLLKSLAILQIPRVTLQMAHHFRLLFACDSIEMPMPFAILFLSPLTIFHSKPSPIALGFLNK